MTKSLTHLKALIREAMDDHLYAEPFYDTPLVKGEDEAADAILDAILTELNITLAPLNPSTEPEPEEP